VQDLIDAFHKRGAARATRLLLPLIVATEAQRGSHALIDSTVLLIEDSCLCSRMLARSGLRDRI